MFKKNFGSVVLHKKSRKFFKRKSKGMDKIRIIDPRTGKVIREDQIAGLPFPYNPAGYLMMYIRLHKDNMERLMCLVDYDDARLIQQFFGKKGAG